MEKITDPTKVAVLDQKLEDLKHIVIKIDAAIEKISEVNSSVSKMLAVHEERITKQEEIDTVLFAKIDKLRDKMDRDHDGVMQRIQLIEKRMWMAVGIGIAVAVGLQLPGVINVLTPSPVAPILAGDRADV